MRNSAWIFNQLTLCPSIESLRVVGDSSILTSVDTVPPLPNLQSAVLQHGMVTRIILPQAKNLQKLTIRDVSSGDEYIRTIDNIPSSVTDLTLIFTNQVEVRHWEKITTKLRQFLVHTPPPNLSRFECKFLGTDSYLDPTKIWEGVLQGSRRGLKLDRVVFKAHALMQMQSASFTKDPNTWTL